MVAHRPSLFLRPRLVAALLLALALPFASAPAWGESLSDLTFAMFKEVKRIRGLKPKGTVGIAERSPEALEVLLKKRIKEEYTTGQLAALQRLLALTGLIPTDYDLVGRYVALLASHALGFYDFKSKTFFLSTRADTSLHASVVLHELVHALQDQHFHVYERLKALKDDEDARTALQALIEGEATAIMLDFTLGLSGKGFYTVPTDELLFYLEGGQEAFKDEPPVMRDFIYFPYEAGLPFIKAVRRRRPWSGVDELYDAPPASAEQVLHPERFLVTPDPPRRVRWPAVPGALRARWRRLDANTLGEFGAYLLVKPFTADEIEAREAAAGWGGDRYLVLEEVEGPGRAVALVAFVWDTERDAEEFVEAYRLGAAARPSTEASASGFGGFSWKARRAQGLGVIERRGDRVLILEGVPPKDLEAFRSLGWSAEVAPPPAGGSPPTMGLARRERFRLVAEAHWKRGDLKQAAFAARQAVSLSASDAEARYLLGSILTVEEATFAEGVDHLTHATVVEPSLGPAHLELGRHMKDLGLADEALTHLSRAHAIMPDHRPASVAYAALLLETGELKAASRVLQPWAESRGRGPELLTILGRTALARGERAAARRHLTAALRLSPSSYANHLASGALEREEGHLKAAEKHLKQASALDKEGTAILVALGDHYRSRGLKDKAEANYRAAVERDPLVPAPAAALGQLALSAGDRNAAAAWFRRALVADPRWRPALEGLKGVRSRQGRPVTRLETLLGRQIAVDEAVRKSLRAGRICFERGLLKRARQQFEKAVRLDDEHPGAWVGLGLVHEREERIGMASSSYLNALASPDPLPPAVSDRLLQWVATRRPPGAFRPILRRFLHAADDEERQRAALTMGALGDRQVVPLLIDHLERRYPPPVKAALVEALGRLGDPAARQPLERLGSTSRDDAVRAAVQRALERLQGPQAR